MKRVEFHGGKTDTRLFGAMNDSPMAIARAVISAVLPLEQPHYHHKATEIYVFFRGRAEMKVDEEVLLVQEGDCVLIEPGEKHCMLRIIEELDYMTIRDSAEEDKVIVE